MRKLIVMIGLILAIISPVRAEWRHARTDHFILTIDDSEENARDFAVRLERFDAALRLLYGVPDNPDQHLRPVAIYAFKEDVFFAACRCPGMAGFYSARTDSSFIMTLHLPNIDRKAKTGGWSSQALLLHEYTHNFVSANFPIAYPYWFQEGFAEFNANTTFEKDGSLIIGYPANYRGDGLLNGSKPSMKRLFDPNQFGYGDDPDLIYGYGWLLTHYLMLKPERHGQLAAYLSAMNKGVPSLKAAQQAFGDLAALDKELSGYRRGLLMAPLRVPPGKPLAAVVTTLSPGEAAMLPAYVGMRTGGTKLYRTGLAQSAQGIAKRYPADAVVAAQLAEIETAAGRFDKADAAADKALAIDPKSVQALIQKGSVGIARAHEAKASDPAVWTAARTWFLKANRADPDQVMPLYLYYMSFVSAKTKPSPGAIKGLMRAAVLAPESDDVRMALAKQFLLDGDAATARSLLQPIAFTPHRPRAKNIPLDALNLIDAGKVEEAKALLTKSDDDDDD